MKKICLLTFLTCAITIVNSQVTLTLVNRSSNFVDSIVIEGTKPFAVGSLDKESSKTFFVSVNQANFHAIAPFDIYVYSIALNTKMQWQKSGFVDTIYFFDHGLSSFDYEPPRPKTFQLYFENISLVKPIPIIASDSAITNITELSPRLFLLALDPQKVGLAQTVSFKLGQKVFTVDLNACNINDWNVRGGSVHFERDSLFIGSKKSLGPFEFVIDFKLQEGISAKDIQLTANTLLKIYVNNNSSSMSAVFDYPKFKSDPKFKIKIGPKIHYVRLNAADIAETEYQEFSISKNEVHRLIR